MAKQTINIGSAPNDGTGDTARDAFDICNDNFTELYDGKLALDGSTEMTGDLVFAEAADHSSTPAAGKGYLWVKNTAPSTLVFTDDAGTDTTLGAGGGGGASQLSDLSDVNTSTPTNRNVLVADGVDWESRALVEADISDFGTYLTTVQLSDLTDVNTSTPTNRNVLVADGVDWESRALTEADISDLGTTAALVSDNLSVFAATTSAQLAGVISDETGSGALVFATSPTLVTPALGTPASGTLTNCTGYPINVVEDTTPQLGGNLDVQANSITTSTVNGGITLTPNGTGDVTLGTMVFDADQTIGAGQDNYVLTYDNAAGKISLEAAAGGSSSAADLTWASGTQSEIADGATAIAFDFNTDNAYSTSGAKLLSLKNNGAEKFFVNYFGGASLGNNTVSGVAANIAIGNTSSVTATSGNGSIAIGRANTVSGRDSYVIGSGSTASGAYSLAIGSSQNATGQSSICIGPYTNTASKPASIAIGSGCDTPFNNSFSFGANRFSANGDAQFVMGVFRAATTDATQTTLQTSFGNDATIPADTTWAFSILVTARSDEADGNDSAAYRIEGCIARDEANNTAIVGTVSVTTIAESAGASAWDVTAEADDTNEALAIKVTGEAATNIRWVAKVDISHVTYA